MPSHGTVQRIVDLFSSQKMTKLVPTQVRDKAVSRDRAGQQAAHSQIATTLMKLWNRFTYFKATKAFFFLNEKQIKTCNFSKQKSVFNGSIEG